MSEEAVEISLSQEDLEIVYSNTAISALLSAMAVTFQGLVELPDGEVLKEILLKDMQKNMESAESPKARNPLPGDEKELLRQYYRVFLALFRLPTLPVNLPHDATKQ